MTLVSQQDAVVAAYRERVGHAPAGVWCAPGRVNLIGEHTDYNDGFVLPFAIDKQVVVAGGRRDDGVLRVTSLQEDEPVEAAVAELAPGSVDGWAAYAVGVAWVMRESGQRVGGAELVLDGDVPPGSGLSSSAALECSVGIALDDLYGLSQPALERGLQAQRAENDYVGMPCGVMDQLTSALGAAGRAMFLDTRSLEVELLPLDPHAAGLRLLTIDTRVKHALTDGPYADRRRACETAAADLGVRALRDVTTDGLDEALSRLDEERGRRVRHIVLENARVLDVAALLRRGDIAEIGPLLTASHASLRDDYEVSAPELDAAVDAALAGGALGARMTGAGFGGSAIALVPADRVDEVVAAVGKAFADRGFRPPVTFEAVPSDGARRLR